MFYQCHIPLNAHPITLLDLGNSALLDMFIQLPLDQFPPDQLPPYHLQSKLLERRPEIKKNYTFFLTGRYNKGFYTDKRKQDIISCYKAKHKVKTPEDTIERYMLTKTHRNDFYLFEKLKILGYSRELHQFMLSLFVFDKTYDV
jgi:hypothetical protein